MKKLLYRLSVVGLSALISASAPAFVSAADAAKPMKDLSFGIIRAPGTEQAKAQALEWLKSAKAVCEHAMLQKDEATRSIAKLLDEVADSPERYKMVAALMFFDMQTWQEKGLGRIGQLMGTVERRLDVARGGPQTQKVEQEIV